MDFKTQKDLFMVLDLGTTSTRAHVIDQKFEFVSGARFESELIQNEDGIAELDPEKYYENIVKILHEALDKSGESVHDIRSLGISCQRSTFITWDKVTGESFHNLITWKDQRAISTMEKVNNSCSLKFIHNGCKVLHALTRQEVFKTLSHIKLSNAWVNHRLQYFIQHNAKLKKAIREKRALFGGLDTWLLMRLRMCQEKHLSDVTSASATGIYDVYKLKFSTPMLMYFGIDRTLLPEVVENDYDFGEVHESILGRAIPIDVIVSDQSSSLVANCCFKPWSAKITLGTGSFLHVNVGSSAKASNYGADPLIAWRLKTGNKKPITVGKQEFMHETSSEAIRFIQTAGLCSDVTQLSDIAKSVEDTGGVIFIPQYFGFEGVRQSTTKAHLIRAVLENIIFNIGYFFFQLLKEAKFKPDKIRIDGGIAQNDFICQQIANLTNVNIERSEKCSELTSIGCAILLSYKKGLLMNLEDAEKFYKSEKIFTPNAEEREKVHSEYQRYLKVVKKS